MTRDEAKEIAEEVYFDSIENGATWDEAVDMVYDWFLDNAGDIADREGNHLPGGEQPWQDDDDERSETLDYILSGIPSEHERDL